MSYEKNSTFRRGTQLLAALLATVALPALAADLSVAPSSATQVAQAPAANSPSPNATINLINLLVKQRVLTEEQAAALIRQANEEAEMARAATGAAPGAVASTPAPAPEGSMRVTYVPEVVRKQLREEIKKEVMTQAKAEKWAAPDTFPEWVSRLGLYGDVRGRYEGDFFPDGNANTGEFPNFNAINTGRPFDVSDANPNFAPQLNVDQNRHRERLRARLGLNADLGENFATGLRLATGNDASPVSTNQTLGRDGGNFSKYNVWLDRAFIKYEPHIEDGLGLSINVGRFDNPFLSTDLVWDGDLGFDGAAVKAKYKVAEGITPFFTVGAFPLFNTDFNFATNQPSKLESKDKWLYAAQGGADWKVNRDFGLKFGAAYYYFDKVEGELSSPCFVFSADDACDTDETRPSFAQKGNSYMSLRNIIPTTENNLGESNQLQFFGLATQFRPLVLTGQVDYDGFAPVRVSLVGEFVKNLGFDKNALEQNAVNNRGPVPDPDEAGDFEGGDIGYLVGVTVGSPALRERWDWNVGLGYRYIESDAMVDAFTDSDFGLGGTNLKGYFLGGNLALGKNVYAGARWMSANEVAGPPFAVDVLQIDLNARF